MKRFLLVGLAGLTAGACGFPSGLTTPTLTSGTALRAAQGSASPCPSPTPTTLPFATFGGSTGVDQCGSVSNPQLNAVFKMNPNPANGNVPLTVNFSMCGSTDTDPSVTLHYHVTHGDGSPDDGASNYCSFAYTYPNGGTFTATECVWDEIPAHAPGACQNFTVNANAPCTVTFPTTFYCGAPFASATVSVHGGPSCGQPLTASASENGVVVATAQTVCPPGATAGSKEISEKFGATGYVGPPAQCTLQFPLPFSSTFPGPPVTIKGTNAAGSITLIPNPNTCVG